MIILITGSSKGIGRYLVEHYCSKKNYFVFGFSRSNSDFQHEMYDHVIGDVTIEKDVKSLVKHIKKSKGHIDVLLNNAGIAYMNHAILSPLDSVNNTFNTNFLGTFLLSRESFKLLKKSRAGRIINFSSIAVPLNLPGNLIYSASKSAVETLTRILAKEIEEFKITVNAIGPGPVKTRLTRSINKEKMDKLIDSQTIKVYTTFDDIINLIDFLSNPLSKCITGQVIYLGGVS